EGRHLTIPSGQFVVAEACSGINYLLATLAVGAMFAYLRYRSLLRRTLFMILALLVPLVANGLRAYGIVMIAHYSDYKYAMGVDHFIYGWVFFGVVIFALFTLGSLFADDEQAALPRRSEGSPARSVGPGILAVAALILALPPLMTFDSVTAVGHLPPAPAPEVPAWTSTASENPFGAVFPGAGQHLSLRYGEDAGDAEVLAEIFHFPGLGRGRELAKQSNVVFDEERAVQLEHRRYAPGGGSLPETVNELRLRRGNEDYLLWYWYEVNGRRVATRIGAKLAQARSKLLREPATGAALILATAVGDDDEPRAVLARFVGATGLRVTVDDGRTEQER
ncbi:MAG: exosortase C-terminal domain/associated protein EpsI, partial [Gammaproteobacteria bacterium]